MLIIIMELPIKKEMC